MSNNENKSGQFLLFPPPSSRVKNEARKQYTGGVYWHHRDAVTFVAIANGIEVDVVLLVTDEEQAQPRVEGVHWHDEQDADDIALLVGDGVGPEMCIDLQEKKKKKKGREIEPR